MPWADVQIEARDLLVRLLRLDTTNPPGREAVAAELVADYLKRNGVEAEVLRAGSGRANLYARLPSAAPASPPLLLLSHLDVVAAEVEAWPSETPPFGGVIEGGAIWGRGAIDAKGLVVVHAVTLALLARQRIPLGRTVLLAATADGERLGEEGIGALIVERPEVLTAGLALTEGGFSVRDLIEGAPPIHAIAIADKGFAELELTATGPKRSGAVPGETEASIRLARALEAIGTLQERPRLTEPVRAFVETVGDALSAPSSWVWSTSPLTRSLTFDALRAEPLTHALIDDRVVVTRLAGGGPGDVVPDRARASLRCHLLPGTTPGGIKARLDRAIDDPKVFVTIHSGEQATTSTVDPGLFAQLEAVLAQDGAIVAPVLSPAATDARWLRRHGVQAYGFSPFLLKRAELETVHGRNERLPLEALDRGLERTFSLLVQLAGSRDLALDRRVTPADSAASPAPP